MNKIITLIMCVAFFATVSGQTVKIEDRVKALEGDVKTLKGQLETQNGQIASVQARLNELADRNTEYKKALDIKQTLNATDADGYQYSFVSAVGDKTTGKLTVTLNLFNPGESREKQMAQAQFTDYAGNAYETNEYQFGNMENVKPTIDSNTNNKLKFHFADASTETKRIASLTVKAYSSTWGNKDMSFNFRDLPVEWK
jgi:DNA repair exonuclease SbcCD ATPase subunit